MIHDIKVIPIPNLTINSNTSKLIPIFDKTNTIILLIKGLEQSINIKSNHTSILPFSFDDVHCDENGFIKKEDVKRIIEFAIILSNFSTKRNIIVSCMGGISRSPAVAISILFILHYETKKVEYMNRIPYMIYRYPHHNQAIRDIISGSYMTSYSKK